MSKPSKRTERQETDSADPGTLVGRQPIHPPTKNRFMFVSAAIAFAAWLMFLAWLAAQTTH